MIYQIQFPLADCRWVQVFVGRMLMPNFIHSERQDWETFGRRWWKLGKINFTSCIAYPQNTKIIVLCYQFKKHDTSCPHKSQNCIIFSDKTSAFMILWMCKHLKDKIRLYYENQFQSVFRYLFRFDCFPFCTFCGESGKGKICLTQMLPFNQVTSKTIPSVDAANMANGLVLWYLNHYFSIMSLFVKPSSIVSRL